ncbi:MAG TPA: hypothetical protein VL147_19115 [Devosia sp.]|nr:hypothetical protein [Devosia sp.]
MTDKRAKRAVVRSGAVAALLCTTWPTLLAQDATVDGVFALPDVPQSVTGQLEVVETGPLSRQIELTYADKSTGKQVADFDVELTQKLHILATDAVLTHLIHQHADKVGADGTFSAELEFPAPGLYHIYTDAAPAGIGQQVLRFDVTVGDAAVAHGEPKASGADVSSGPLVSSDGPYTITLDASQLRPGAESAVALLVEKNGAPATDLEPYLGVSAHAVFIHAEDLAYVHAHAMPSSDGQDHQTHDAHSAAAGMNAPHAPAGDAHSHHHETGAANGTVGSSVPAVGDEDDHGQDALNHGGEHGHNEGPTSAVSPEMSLHVTPPAAGTYALWIEFIGAEEVRTVPFTIEIP